MVVQTKAASGWSSGSVGSSSECAVLVKQPASVLLHPRWGLGAFWPYRNQAEALGSFGSCTWTLSVLSCQVFLGLV